MSKSQHKYIPRGSVTVCAVDDCNQPHYSKRFCRRHYSQWKKWGDPTVKGRMGSPAPPPLVLTDAGDGCRAEGCGRAVAGQGLCDRHYRQARREGIISPLPRIEWCAVDGCDREHSSRGFCKLHYDRWVRWGDPLRVEPGGAPVRPIVTYQGAHLRIYRSRGKASDQKCVDCGQQADEWSFRHDAVNVRVGPFPDADKGFGRYSTDPYEYEPRCRPCHRRYDQSQDQTEEAS